MMMVIQLLLSQSGMELASCDDDPSVAAADAGELLTRARVESSLGASVVCAPTFPRSMEASAEAPSG